MSSVFSVGGVSLTSSELEMIGRRCRSVEIFDILQRAFDDSVSTGDRVVIPKDTDSERAFEAMESFREALARGISLPPKLVMTANPAPRPIWIGIDWAKPEVES